jgi:preprotein translocase SecE subunit
VKGDWPALRTVPWPASWHDDCYLSGFNVRRTGRFLSRQRYVLLSFFLLALVVGFSLDAALSSAFAQFGFADNRIGGVLSTTSALAVTGAGLTLVILLRNKAAMTFWTEVVGEMLRVTWPSREESVKAATTVVGTTLFAATVLAVYDYLWFNLAKLVLLTGG